MPIKGLAVKAKETEDMPFQLSPREVVVGAVEQATLLKDIVEKQAMFELIDNKEYLLVEGWQTIGAFNNVNAITEYVKPIERQGEIIGYEAKVNLIKKGEIVGGAILTCGLDEFPCRGKEGEAKHKAARSAAQTWAESKAYRMKYGYIAKLAGYEPTPAEEMHTEIETTKTKPLKTKEHWCSIHNTAFFKTPKMKWYAHPIKGEKTADGKDVWCNENKAKEQKSEQPTEQVDTEPASSQLEESVMPQLSYDLRAGLEKLYEAKVWNLRKTEEKLEQYGGKGDSFKQKLESLGKDMELKLLEEINAILQKG